MSSPQHPVPCRHHAPHPAALDRAVWAACTWPDDPAATTDEQILERLLALNIGRAG